MAAPACVNCVYSICDPELWLRRLWAGEPLLPRCANHPCWPGQLRDVPGVACRNYRPRPRVPDGDVRLIPLGDGFYAYVDAADYEWLSQWTWRMCSAGYAGRNENGKTILMHREILKPPKGMVVDHIDGNKANNCRSNIRVCTRQENQRNLRKQRCAWSRYKGVFFDKRYGYCYARCRFAGRFWYLGSFDNELDAARAYDRAAVAWFGKFAHLNFPEEWPPERRARVYADAAAERETLIAKVAEAKRQRAEKAKAKSQKAKREERKAKTKSKSTPPRAQSKGRPKRKRPRPDAQPATKSPSSKTHRPRKSSEAA